MIDQYFDYFGITAGILIIVGVGLVFFLIVAYILERRTRLIFPDRKRSDDDFSLFDDDDDDDNEENNE